MARRANHDLVDIACQLVHQTELAWLLDCGDTKPVWVPKSVCELDVDSKGVGTVTLPESWAQDKGMI
jgi:hypothetical protein